MGKKKFEIGDLVYNSFWDELGIICAVFKRPGYVTHYSYEINFKSHGLYYDSENRIMVHDCDNTLTLIEKSAFT